MIVYSEEQIQKIYDMAYACMPLKDISYALGVDYYQLRDSIHVEGSDANKAYRSAKSMVKYDLYKKRREKALEGDAAAMEQCRQALIDMEEDE